MAEESRTKPIGPESWQCGTIKQIKLSQAVLARAGKGVHASKSMDVLPSLRDTMIQGNNQRIHGYVREVRGVASNLTTCLGNVNDEIKSLTRCKERIEKALEYRRKDIALNSQSSKIRGRRPQREKDSDGADELLSAERVHLFVLKHKLEGQLDRVQGHLQMLASLRSRLLAAIQERSRVLQLTCRARSSVALCGGERTVSRRDSVSIEADPLGAFTPDCSMLVNETATGLETGKRVRAEAASVVSHTERLQKASHDSVNEGLTRKLAETITLKQHLQLAVGDTRASIQKANRWHDVQRLARGYTMGPVSYADISTRERLNRPLVRVYQSHPGTDLPEARRLVRADGGLDRSIAETQRNVGLLTLAKAGLQEDVRDKRAAAGIDGRIVRLRRSKADHRWVGVN